MPPKSAFETPTERASIAVYRLFDPDAEAWESWSLQLRGYLEVNSVVDDRIKRGCLVTSLPPKCFKELRRVCLLKSPFGYAYFYLGAFMMKLYGNRVVLLKERSKFFGLQRGPNQSRMQFANYLRHMAESCDFDQFSTEAALVVQFVYGIRNQSVKLKLLAKGKDLTLEDALSSLQIAEDIRRVDSKSSNEAMDAKTCHSVKTYPRRNNVDRPLGKCDRCGKGDHGKDACPFIRFRIEYRNSKGFGHADGLSRLPLTSEELFNNAFDRYEAAGELMIRQLVAEVRRELSVTVAEIADCTLKDIR
uniref:Retrotransposon gag domain-containing protein n=1 Tax=Trichuris muris TaxID=70415 RepID=A0A5S6R0A0_TRIMR